MSLLILAATVAFTPIPEYDSEAYCSYMEANPALRKYVQNGCLAQEAKAKANTLLTWADLSEADRKHCSTLAGFGGGSYMTLLLCGVVLDTAWVQRSVALIDKAPPEITTEAAPPCRDGADTCLPWERSWKEGDKLAPGDRVTEEGTIYRMPE